MNPIDAYLQKKAAFGQAWGAVKPVLKEVAVPIGVGAGIAGVSGGIVGIYRAITKQRDFKRMLSANPDLQEAHQANPEQFNLHYNSFRSLNPRFAADPVVSGTYLRQMNMNPGTAGHVIVESLSAAQEGVLKPSTTAKWMGGKSPGSSLEFKIGR